MYISTIYVHPYSFANVVDVKKTKLVSQKPYTTGNKGLCRATIYTAKGVICTTKALPCDAARQCH
jgi:hypothetical protein